MKKAIEAFPISQEEAEDVDTLRDTFPNKSDLRSALEDYFHIYDDYAEMTTQEFDRYFADYMSDYEEPEFIEDVPLESSRKSVKSSKIGDVHDRYVRGEMTDDQLKKELAENGYDDDKIEKLSEKWGRKVVKSALEEQQKQDLKESLIRAGYSEQEADSILLQAEQISNGEQTF